MDIKRGERDEGEELENGYIVGGERDEAELENGYREERKNAERETRVWRKRMERVRERRGCGEREWRE